MVQLAYLEVSYSSNHIFIILIILWYLWIINLSIKKNLSIMLLPINWWKILLYYNLESHSRMAKISKKLCPILFYKIVTLSSIERVTVMFIVVILHQFIDNFLIHLDILIKKNLPVQSALVRIHDTKYPVRKIIFFRF